MSDDDIGNDEPGLETSAAVEDAARMTDPVDTLAGDTPDENMDTAARTGDGPASAEAGPDPDGQAGAKKSQSRGVFHGVPIEVTVSVGKARPTVSDLVELRRDSVLELDSSVDDPVELYIGDRLIARGELQEIGEGGNRLGVRLTEVADFSNDM